MLCKTFETVAERIINSLANWEDIMRISRIRDWIKYKIDNILSKGTVSLILILAILTFLIAILAGTAVILIEKTWAQSSLLYAIWKSFTLTLDASNLANIEGSKGIVAVAAIVTMSGIFITSTLISIINTGLAARLENLRRGTSRVLEKNHVVILGYNETTFAIIRQLQIANENIKDGCIVVLGKEDKQIMDEQMMRRVSKTKSTRIICRNGDPTSFHDLGRCSLETCKSIIVNQEKDETVIRFILACKNYLSQDKIINSYPHAKNIHIVASLSDESNLQVAKIAGWEMTDVIHFNRIISRLMVHVCYQPGLSSVFMELFDFKGDEIYIESHPKLSGLCFGEANRSFEKASVIGILRNRKVLINPPEQEKIKHDDQIVLIAEDDGVAVALDRPVLPSTKSTRSLELSNKQKYNTYNLLILGNNDLLTDIISELNIYFPEGSGITIANSLAENCRELFQSSKFNINLDLKWIEADVSKREVLEKLVFQRYSHILILSDKKLDAVASDAKTLTILMHIRDLAKKYNLDFGITTEMIEARSQELAQGTNVSDFVISNKISSLILTQLSENPKLLEIFNELFDSEGSEIYLKPAFRYVNINFELDLFTLAYEVSLQNEVFIGYKKIISEPGQLEKQDIVINPDKRKRISFTEKDSLIVIAKD